MTDRLHDGLFGRVYPEPEPYRPDRPDWQDAAACNGMDPDLFFPPHGAGHPGHLDSFEARATCAGCPVRVECLEYALANNEDWGIWGGTSERERRRIKKQRRRLGVAS